MNTLRLVATVSGKWALFRCCDAPQKIKKERKGEERRERKRRKEGKEERN